MPKYNPTDNRSKSARFRHPIFYTGSLYLLFSVATLGSYLTSGCSLLIGNVKPIAEKSESYEYLDLSSQSKSWKKLSDSSAGGSKPVATAHAITTPQVIESDSNIEPSNNDDAQSNDNTDLAFQSKNNSSIISLNSACRVSFSDDLSQSQAQLRAKANELLLGITHITERDEKMIEVQKTPALETTIQGELNQESVRIRTIVLNAKGCLYDLMYIAKPEHFNESESDFKKFVLGFKLK